MERNTEKCSNANIIERWNNGTTKCSNDNTPGHLSDRGVCSSDKAAKGLGDEMGAEGLSDEAAEHPDDEAARRLSDDTVKDDTSTGCPNDDMRDDNRGAGIWNVRDDSETFGSSVRDGETGSQRRNIRMETEEWVRSGTNEIIS